MVVKKPFHFLAGKMGLPNLKRGTREDFLCNGTFHQATGFLFALAQFFGVMPVIGVRSKNPLDLRFTWKSLRFFFCIFFMMCVFLQTLLVIWWMLKHELELNKVVNVMFYGSNFFAILQFLVLAEKWPMVMMKWQKAEQNLPPLNTYGEKIKLSYQIKIMSFIIMIISLTEHLLSLIVSLHDANNCAAIRDPIKAYFMKSFPSSFYIFNYSGEAGMFFETVNTVATFVWTYNDLFVIIVSVGLSFRFKQINNDLMKAKGKIMSSNYWAEQRLYYRTICELISNVDRAISVISMISMSNNLFFICIQLLNSLDKKETMAHSFYFWFSLIFLIIRTLMVSLYTAEVNDESKRPLEVFRTITKDGWCLEAKRFCEEVTNDIVALTGMNFFNLTRKLVLSVAGTIVTYELVLIQFHKSGKVDINDPCLLKNETARALIYNNMINVNLNLNKN